MRNANHDPGNMKDDPGSKINGGFPGVWEIDISEFDATLPAPGKVIHRLSPRHIVAGVWEFEPS